jgi:hypothetical protein
MRQMDERHALSWQNLRNGVKLQIMAAGKDRKGVFYGSEQEL